MVKVSDREEVEEWGNREEREHVKRERFISRVAPSLALKTEPMMLVPAQIGKVSSPLEANKRHLWHLTFRP